MVHEQGYCFSLCSTRNTMQHGHGHSVSLPSVMKCIDVFHDTNLL